MDEQGIYEILAELGVDWDSISSNGTNMKASCPLAPWTHADGIDKHPSLTIKIEPEGASLFQCFTSTCRAKGKLANLVLEVWRRRGKPQDWIPFVERTIRQEESSLDREIERTASLFKPPSKREKSKAEKLNDMLELIPESEIRAFMKAGPPPYFKKLGFTPRDARYWECGWDKEGCRMFFPVRRRDGALVGGTGRALKKNIEPKWFHYFSLKTGNYLFGEHKLPKRREQLKGLVIVEGVTDCIQTTRALRSADRYSGFRCLAQFGCQMTETQVKKVLGLSCPVYLFPDNNDTGEGKEGMRSNVEYLLGRVPLFIMDTDEGYDPGATPIERIVELLDAGRPPLKDEIRPKKTRRRFFAKQRT